MRTALTEGVTRLSQCVPDEDRQVHVAQYLFEGDDGESVLVDTGSTYGREEMVADLEDALDGGSLGAVLLTHSTLPHTENLDLLADRWPEMEVIAATNNPTVAGLRNYAERTKPKVLNESRTYAGRRFSFLDPLLTDVVSSNWLYEHEAKMLITAEGLGHYHDPGACADTSAAMADGIPYEYIHEFNRDKLPFLKAIDSAKLRDGFDALFDLYDVEWVAPIHGNAVARADIEDYIEKTIRSAGEIAEAWDPPQMPDS